MTLLFELLEDDSPATQQAKQMGLVSKGWGRWADPRTGVITHKTVDGVLTKVDPTEQPKRRPKRKRRIPLEPQGTNKDRGLLPSPHKVPVEQAKTKKDPSFDELRESAEGVGYTVMSTEPLESIKSKLQGARADFKPNGFWFGVDASWVDFVAYEMPDWKGDNLYSVGVDESKCLVLSSYKDLMNFTRKYAAVQSDPWGTRSLESSMIDWGAVSKEYGGIIIKPYINEARMNLMWYYPWDVASGCIWDTSAIKSVKQISIT